MKNQRNPPPLYYVANKNSDSNINANNTDIPENISDNDFDELDIFHVIERPNSEHDDHIENLDKNQL